jgi:DNA-3-methyladenine glycosylase
MRAARAAGRRDGQPPADRDLCRGPANLTSALGIDRTQDGCDLLAGSPRPDAPLLRAGEPVPSGAIARGPRIGITRAVTVEWRFWVAGSPYVSGPVMQPAR